MSDWPCTSSQKGHLLQLCRCICGICDRGMVLLHSQHCRLLVRPPCIPESIHSSLHYTLSNPQIRCVAANILWQPFSLPCLEIFST